MTLPRRPMLHDSADAAARTAGLSRGRWGAAIGICAIMLALTSCGTSPASESSAPAAAEQDSATEPAPVSEAEPDAESMDDASQAESCDWDSPQISPPADAPQVQEGELAEVLVGSWQHTHTDEGSGFEEVANDYRYVFSSPDRLLYCQHVPGVTDHAENAAYVVLNGTTIELPGGKYGYTVTAWDAQTMVWDNPVGRGYVYLLQRR